VGWQIAYCLFAELQRHPHNLTSINKDQKQCLIQLINPPWNKLMKLEICSEDLILGYNVIWVCWIIHCQSSLSTISEKRNRNIINTKFEAYVVAILLISQIIIGLPYIGYSLVWCPGQNKRKARLSCLHGCRKRRLKD
jgi:hypothetical protein